MQRQRMSVLLLLAIYLIINSLGCIGLPKRPNGFVYHIDIINGVAYQFSVPKSAYGDFKYTGKDRHLTELDKYFCVSPDYQFDLQAWMQDVEDYAKDKCE